MELLLLIPLFFLSAFFSGSETAIYSMSTVRLDYLHAQGAWRARVLRWLRRPIAPTIITILIANNIVAEMLARITEQSLAHLGVLSVVITTIVITPLLIVFGEFLPKWIGRSRADTILYQVVIALAGVRIALSPLVLLCRGLTQMVRALVPGRGGLVWEPHSSRPNLRNFMRSPENKQVLGPVQQRLADRILALEKVTLSYDRITRPLEAVTMLEQSAPIADTIAKLGPKYYQRYLVGDSFSRWPSGWVSAQAMVVSEGHLRLSDIAQPLPRLPINTPLHIALQRMHAEGAEMVLVVDDYGRAVRIAFRGDCLRALMSLDQPRSAN
ncbi:MAG: DUF21 domain-containing protein [Planctomycetota bacterium]|nr:MAG: DUF21 domain-containing protein [Planctomycetota bacterium]